MTQPDKPNSRLQKYRLTQAGEDQKIYADHYHDPPKKTALITGITAQDGSCACYHSFIT